MNFFDAFKKLWGSSGTVDDGLSEAQYQAGWDYIGLTPPELGQFNKREKLIDEKIKWLYEQLETAAQQRGVSLAGSDITSLAQLLSLSDALPKIAGVASAGTSNLPARSDHVHPTDNTSVVAPGFVMPFAGITPPSGWLKANGVAVSRTTYSALFGAIGTTYGVGDGITTFGLPDLRGEFIRGWDDGRGVDAGRVLGSRQIGTLVAGNFDVVRQAAGMDATSGTYASNFGADQPTADELTGKQFSQSLPSYTDTFNASTYPGYIGATRPRNVAMLYCIKY